MDIFHSWDKDRDEKVTREEFLAVRRCPDAHARRVDA